MSRAFLVTGLVLLSGGTALALVDGLRDARASAPSASARDAHSVAAPTSHAPALPPRVADASISESQSELIALAARAASAMPLFPHAKSRARAQEAVVTTCFEMNLPRRALTYADGIENWRRGACYADYAFYCAQHDDTSEVDVYLDRAHKISETAADESDSDEDSQAWRRDRIRAKIARTHLWLGEMQAAPSAIVPSESGTVDTVKAMLVDAADLDAAIASMQAPCSTGDFDQARNALGACVQLFDRFYDDAERRAKIDARIQSCWQSVPIDLRIQIGMELARVALKHADRSTALAYVDTAHGWLQRSRWLTEHRIALVARLAEIRFRAGDEAGARKQADAALTAFESSREQIVDIYRAEALRPLAEAYHAMGDRKAASRVYALAVQEGSVNPNSRPRAEDLSATCLSMASHAFEPEENLRARMLEICEALGDPW